MDSDVQHRGDIAGDRLPPPVIEAGMPLREHRCGARHELDARVPMFAEPLVELMHTHRDEIVERVSLELGQSALRDLVLDE